MFTTKRGFQSCRDILIARLLMQTLDHSIEYLLGDGTVILRPRRRRFHHNRTLAAAPAPPAAKLRRAGATKAEDNSADDLGRRDWDES